MALGSKGAPDFKKMVKSLSIGDIVQTSDSISSEANRTSISAGQKTVAAAGTAEKLSAQAIPDGFELVIKALNSNTAVVHVATSKADAETDADAYQLQPSEFVVLKVDNQDKIWVDANVNGEGVTFVVES